MSLFDNPLGRMYGPFFLILYALVCLAAILYVRYMLPNRIIRADAGKHKIPDRPDPYEIAYLWQTENELLVLVIYNLVRRGYMTLTQTKTHILIRQNTADVTLLSMMEKDVYNRLEKECALNTFVKDVYRDSPFKVHTEALDKHLIQQDLLWSDYDTDDFRKRRMLIVTGLIFFGLYKIAAALYYGYTNVFGIILILLFTAMLMSSIKVNKLTTPKGRRLHEELKQIFRAVQGENLLKQPLYIEQLLLGIYGFGLLKGSVYDGFYASAAADLKIQAAIVFENNGSSGSSCSGSGCSGGSGCGGGCGGCGGCGG